VNQDLVNIYFTQVPFFFFNFRELAVLRRLEVVLYFRLKYLCIIFSLSNYLAFDFILHVPKPSVHLECNWKKYFFNKLVTS